VLLFHDKLNPTVVRLDILLELIIKLVGNVAIYTVVEVPKTEFLTGVTTTVYKVPGNNP
jgi:hypothetical protein